MSKSPRTKVLSACHSASLERGSGANRRNESEDKGGGGGEVDHVGC